MKQISSEHNPIYKNLKALATSAKARKLQNQTILDGIHLAQSFLQTQMQPISCIISESAQDNAEVGEIFRECQKRDASMLIVSDPQFRALSTVENGVGVLLVIEKPAPASLSEVKTSAVLLDSVQDPGNVGTILRTAAAAGIATIYSSSQTADLWSPKVLRAGMGAHFSLMMYENVDLANVIQSASVPVYATTLEAARTIYELDLSGPTAWIVGNEGQGVSVTLLNASVEQVIIPQNADVESLNVAAAAAVCLFEQRRQQLLAQA